MNAFSRGIVAALAIGTIVAGAGTAVAQAAPGDLDPSFSKDGKALVGFPKYELDRRGTVAVVAVGSDDKSVLVTTVRKKPPKKDEHDRGSDGKPTDIALARLNMKGSYDRRFSGDGRVIIRIPGNEVAIAAAAQADGKTVVAASSANDMMVLRVTRKGSLDPSFSGDGRTTVDFGLEDGAGGVAVQPDGAIVMVGSVNQSSSTRTHSDFGIARLTPAGALDTSFSGDGLTTADFTTPGVAEPSDDRARSVAIRADGRIVVAGGATTNGEYSSERDFAIAQLLPNGDPDPSFGGGAVTSNIGAGGGAALALQGDGSAVVGGTAAGNFAAARLDLVGVLDPAFAGDGTALVDISGGDDDADAIAIQEDNKSVLVGGARGIRGDRDYGILRLTAAGLPDQTFSENGKVTIDLTGGFDDADSIQFQSDGKLVVAGTAGENKVGVIRELVAEGKADFDADGVADVDDACPDQFGRRANGCPKRSRE